MAEHLKHAMDTKIPQVLSTMLTLSIRYGVVPSSFCKGLLIPILKKPTLDPSSPKNYRPVTVSSIMSKILELYILDKSAHHIPSDLQFGFVEGRSTCMAAVLTNDVINYSVNRGSPVYTCALDAEGAFDAIPHEILFQKAIGVVPDHCWVVLVTWYKTITVQVKWRNQLSDHIKVGKGTRQGGLSSPFLFNLFYQDLIEELSKCIGGIKVN